MKRLKNKRKIVESAYEWCCAKFGTPLKTGLYPELEIVSKPKSDLCGEYLDRCLIINTCLCQTKSALIRVVIHEYTHFLQMPKIRDMSKYSKLYRNFEYHNHPMEVEAYNAELKYYRSCYRDLKKKGAFS